MIEKRHVYPIRRTQFIGYDTRRFRKDEKGKIVGYDAPLELKSGETLNFVDGPKVNEPTKDQALGSFDFALKAWLTDKKGVILWKDAPTTIRDLTGWSVHCRLAVTQDMRFTNPDELAAPSAIPARVPAMTIEEMLVRK